MKFLVVLFILITELHIANAQYSHSKEIGVKGKVKKITCIYYAEGVASNNSWSPKDSSKFTTKTVSYYNSSQNLDSVQTFVNHAGKEKIALRKGYTYVKNADITGWGYDYTNDINYTIKVEWLDKSTYIEMATDASGKNRMSSKVYLDDKFHVIKHEDQLYRDGELFDHSITETKFNPDNTEHAVSITESKVSNLEYSEDEYVARRDSKGNPIKKTYKNGINTFRSIRFYIIEYDE